MAIPTHVKIINEARTNRAGEWNLCFQWCRYIHAEEEDEMGYRFIWRHPDEKLQPARGQARIPSLKDLEYLVGIAKAEGWGGNDGGSLVD